MWIQWESLWTACRMGFSPLSLLLYPTPNCWNTDLGDQGTYRNQYKRSVVGRAISENHLLHLSVEVPISKQKPRVESDLEIMEVYPFYVLKPISFIVIYIESLSNSWCLCLSQRNCATFFNLPSLICHHLWCSKAYIEKKKNLRLSWDLLLW